MTQILLLFGVLVDFLYKDLLSKCIWSLVLENGPVSSVFSQFRPDLGHIKAAHCFWVLEHWQRLKLPNDERRRERDSDKNTK